MNINWYISNLFGTMHFWNNLPMEKSMTGRAHVMSCNHSSSKNNFGLENNLSITFLDIGKVYHNSEFQHIDYKRGYIRITPYYSEFVRGVPPGNL